MKLIKKILSVFLCLTVIIGSLSVGSFSVSAASVKGNRGADGKGFIYKKTAEYTYTDANGKKHSQLQDRYSCVLVCHPTFQFDIHNHILEIPSKNPAN